MPTPTAGATQAKRDRTIGAEYAELRDAARLLLAALSVAKDEIHNPGAWQHGNIARDGDISDYIDNAIRVARKAGIPTT